MSRAPQRSAASNPLPAPGTAPVVLWLGVWTLYSREVRRFLKIYTQTMVAPLVTSLLFMAVFSLALGRAVQTVGAVPFTTFLAPGLIMMVVTQNAFANTSSSLLISKVQGNIIDILMPPLSPTELTMGFALGGATRGVMIGIVAALAMSFFADLSIHSLFFVVFHLISAALMLSLLGTAGGIWSEKFDHIAAFTNFVVVPLSFLSGTFYSIERLPEMVRLLAHLNPFFYMIDGFRYGFIGQADSNLALGIAVMCGVNAGLWALCHWMFKSGYKLKA